jgi:hypothetical protein
MVAYDPPNWYYNTLTTTSSSIYPQYVITSPSQYVNDTSFSPNPPPKPETDLDWLRKQVDSVCALAKL